MKLLEFTSFTYRHGRCTRNSYDREPLFQTIHSTKTQLLFVPLQWNCSLPRQQTLFHTFLKPYCLEERDCKKRSQCLHKGKVIKLYSIAVAAFMQLSSNEGP